MSPAGREIDPALIAGWLVRSVARQPEQPDEVLARMIGTTRAQIAAARAAAAERDTLVLVAGSAAVASAAAAAGATRPELGWRRDAA